MAKNHHEDTLLGVLTKNFLGNPLYLILLFDKLLRIVFYSNGIESVKNVESFAKHWLIKIDISAVFLGFLLLKLD